MDTDDEIQALNQRTNISDGHNKPNIAEAMSEQHVMGVYTVMLKLFLIHTTM